MSFFVGFETKIYPGNTQMDWLKDNTNLSWCGYYLAPAPSRKDTSWKGNLPHLQTKGWNCVAIYLGQETSGQGSHNITPDQGITDGQDAAALAAAEGFPSNSYIYLDIEDGSAMTSAVISYIQSWTKSLMENQYLPGFYCSHLIADALREAIDEVNPAKNTRIWAWKVKTRDNHPYAGDAADIPASNPAGCGYSQASAWQFQQNCVLSLPNAPTTSMSVDLSSSTSKSPGASG